MDGFKLDDKYDHHDNAKYNEFQDDFERGDLSGPFELKLIAIRGFITQGGQTLELVSAERVTGGGCQVCGGTPEGGFVSPPAQEIPCMISKFEQHCAMAAIRYKKATRWASPEGNFLAIPRKLRGPLTLIILGNCFSVLCCSVDRKNQTPLQFM